MSDRNYNHLSYSELKVMMKENQTLIETSAIKLDEISQSLSEIDDKQNYLIQLMLNKNITQSQEAERQRDLQRLQKSHKEFTRG